MWGGLYPIGVETYTLPMSKYNSYLGLGSFDRSDLSLNWSNRPWTGLTGQTEVQVFLEA